MSAISVFDERSYDWAPAYTDELVALIKQLSGASEVLVRALGWEVHDFSDGNGTVEFCHNDYTAASVGRHIAEIVRNSERAEERLAKRSQFVPICGAWSHRPLRASRWRFATPRRWLSPDLQFRE